MPEQGRILEQGLCRAGDVLRRFAALPLCGLATLTGDATVLVLAPHADDESLGCGGLIAEACRRGQPPVVAVLTDGIGSHPNSPSHPPAVLRARREREAREATAILGLPPGRLYFLGVRDTSGPLAGPEFDRAVAELLRLVGHHGCGLIASPWRHDPHCDHEAAHAMAVAVAEAAGVRLLSYPVWGWTLPPDASLPDVPVAGWRLDMAAHLPAKRRAIAAHATQYSDAITDDPAGFRLPPGLLAVFDRPYEVYLTIP